MYYQFTDRSQKTLTKSFSHFCLVFQITSNANMLPQLENAKATVHVCV